MYALRPEQQAAGALRWIQLGTDTFCAERPAPRKEIPYRLNVDLLICSCVVLFRPLKTRMTNTTTPNINHNKAHNVTEEHVDYVVYRYSRCCSSARLAAPPKERKQTKIYLYATHTL